MATFYFQLLDHDGVRPTEMSYAFGSVEAAIDEARTALTEMAADGLPTSDYNMLSVEIFDEQRNPVREIRLILEEVDKTGRGTPDTDPLETGKCAGPTQTGSK